MTGQAGRPPLRPEVIAKILELYFEKHWGYKKIGGKLNIGRSTVRRILRKHAEGGLYSIERAKRAAGGGT